MKQTLGSKGVSHSHLPNSLLFPFALGVDAGMCEGGEMSDYEFCHSFLLLSQQFYAQNGDT